MIQYWKNRRNKNKSHIKTYGLSMDTCRLAISDILHVSTMIIEGNTGADPGFEKGGANLGDFLKKTAQKMVGVHPLPTPPPLDPRLFNKL